MTINPTPLQSNHNTNEPTNNPSSDKDGMATNVLWQVLTLMAQDVYQPPPNHQQHPLLCQNYYPNMASSNCNRDDTKQAPPSNQSHGG